MDEKLLAIVYETVASCSAAPVPPNIGRDEDIIAKEIMDSMTLLQTAVMLQERFGILIDEADLVPQNFRSLGSMCGFLERMGAHA
ncbi:phosphopantetheine-binding protein [Streptomyces sp. NBC_00441]|uniref:acyl carrier protein n=1 Tax=Streptomyces sp. NBC_00441 TaxID=2975742 RepID=UPI002E2D6CAF|nr:phosphopantetheine-binding protein [Streptomyces sp. NBC_00441]